jgi:hypothetical protein
LKKPVHDELIESLAELRRALPSMRLGQLIANMATVARGAVPGAIWETEDKELLGAIRWQLEQLASRATAENSGAVVKDPFRQSKRRHPAKVGRTRRVK